VHSHDDRHQLYDRVNDPGEHRNLALEPAHAELSRQLDSQLCASWQMPDISDVPKIRGDARG
jgi:hypothetical protein